MIRELFHSSDSEQVGGGWSRRSRGRSRRLLRRLLIVAAIAVLVLLLARPVRSVIHRWQARRHAANALAFIDEQKWKAARDEASAALLLRPGEPQAIRAIARYLSRVGDINALKFWSMLAEKSQLTRTDLRDKAAIAIKGRELDQARDAVDRLLGGSPGESEPADWLLAAQLAIQEKDFDRAYNELNAVFASNAASNEEQLQAVSLLEVVSRFRSGSLEPVVLRRLSELAKGKDNAALEALTILAYRAIDTKSGPAVPDDLSENDIIQLLESHPLAKPIHQLTAASLKIHVHPEERDAVVKQAIARWKGDDNATMATLAGWLNQQGEYQQELDLVPETRAMQTRELFSLHVAALEKLGRWDDIRRLIESEQFPLDPVVEHMYLAECLSQQGEADAANNNWDRALQEGAGDLNKLMALADYAEKHSAYDAAMAAYEAAVALSPRLRAAQLARLRVASSQYDTKKIGRILYEMLRIWPNDPGTQSDEGFIRLLRMPASGGNPTAIDSVKQTADALIRREPNSLSHRTVLALAFLRAGTPNEALGAYSNIRPTSAMSPATMVVHAAVLAANNHLPEARAEAAKIREQDLLPEEKALLQF